MNNLIQYRKKILIGAAGIFLIWMLVSPSGSDETEALTFAARQGRLVINVLEGGAIEALESQKIRSEIKGYEGTKILSLVEEGYQITPQDVATNKILVELDSSKLEDREKTQLISIESTSASLIEAVNGKEIQLSQNRSEIKAAAQKARFSRLDFEKYMGVKAAQKILKELELDKLLDEATAPIEAVEINVLQEASVPESPPPVHNPEAAVLHKAFSGGKKNADMAENEALDLEATSTPSDPEISPHGTVVDAELKESPIDFTRYTEPENEHLLGDGEAMQKLRELTDKHLVAEEEGSLALEEFEGTKRLYEKDFVTSNELEKNRIALKQKTLNVKSAETVLNLYRQYELPKTAEEFLSKYEEALQAFMRTRKDAIAKLAQAEAKLKSAQQRFNIEKMQLKEIQDQLKKCTIHAKTVGMAVYGGDGEHYWREEQIRAGGLVRERQSILTIPDMNTMAVKVKIPEAYIKKVKVGQSVRVTLDAEPDKDLDGEVIKVAVLPDSENRYRNPNNKVYVTMVKIKGVHDWLKPGMTAKVEIFVDELENVVYVPFQSVYREMGDYFCYVRKGRQPEKRKVEIGQYNDEFVEIRNGMKKGESVLLTIPEDLKSETETTSDESSTNEDSTDADESSSPEAQP